MTQRLHELLKTQARRFLRDRRSPTVRWFRRFLGTVNQTYWKDEESRRFLERSLDLTSQEVVRRDSLLRAIFQTFPDLCLVVSDADLITEANGGPVNGATASASRWLGRNVETFPDPRTGVQFRESVEQARRSKGPVTLEWSETEGRRHNHFEARLRAMEDGQVLVLVRDNTARKAALEALRASEERYALAARAANDGLWDWDLAGGRLYLSPRWKSMLGHQESEIGSAPEAWFERVHPDDAEALRRALGAIGGAGSDLFEIEYRIRHRDGTYRWVLTRGIAVRDAAGVAHRIVGSQTDISVRKSAEERLRHEAFHDRVTGLANRALFMDRLANVLDRVKRQPGYLFAVLYVDLDRFSALNERLGHDAGDRLLQTAAARLRSYGRVGDTVARVGDDEFAILLDGIANERAALVFAERMRDLLSSPCDVGPEEVAVTASMGITLYNPDTTTAEAVLSEAESAMHRAKEAGKNRQELFSREIYDRLVSKLRTESELRHAAERGQLELHYQPIFSIAEGRILRLEALLRWTHPHRGAISPLDFIPVAEETGLILELGSWVLGEVAEQVGRWRAAGCRPVAVAVNCSPRQFQDPALLTSVGACLEKCGAAGFPLELEITESAAMQDVDQSVKLLKSLRAMGVRISMDDFGVGYSSLSCLRLFPLNTLKIDRAFVQGLPRVKDSTAITNAIIGIGHSLGLTLAAEGVETVDQLDYLRAARCEEAQGFLLGRPLPAKDTTPLLFPQSEAAGPSPALTPSAP